MAKTKPRLLTSETYGSNIVSLRLGAWSFISCRCRQSPLMRRSIVQCCCCWCWLAVTRSAFRLCAGQ